MALGAAEEVGDRAPQAYDRVAAAEEPIEQGADDPQEPMRDFLASARHGPVVVAVIVLGLLLLVTTKQQPVEIRNTYGEAKAPSPSSASSGLEARIIQLEQSIATIARPEPSTRTGACTCPDVAALTQRLATLEAKSALWASHGAPEIVPQQPLEDPVAAAQLENLRGGQQELTDRLTSLEQKLANPNLKASERTPVNDNAMVHKPTLTKDMRLAASSFFFMTPETFVLKENAVKDGDRSWLAH